MLYLITTAAVAYVAYAIGYQTGHRAGWIVAKRLALVLRYPGLVRMDK